MAGPLEGIRVVDCSRGEAGARMTWLLADYGADVVRVEPPEGDPWRDRLAVKYAVYHRNKRSIELDLRNENGREALLGLLETADVFVETWRPGVASATRSELRGRARARPEAGLLLHLRLRGRVGLCRHAGLRGARARGDRHDERTVRTP